MGDYPTNAELKTIRHWPGTFKGLWEYVKSIWWGADWGIHEDFSSEKYKLELHTGGWSGNESIISAFEKSKCRFFWWNHVKWERGGHYYFEIYPSTWDRDMSFKPADNAKDANNA
jgi:hypothetical protein